MRCWLRWSHWTCSIPSLPEPERSSLISSRRQTSVFRLAQTLTCSLTKAEARLFQFQRNWSVNLNPKDNNRAHWGKISSLGPKTPGPSSRTYTQTSNLPLGSFDCLHRAPETIATEMMKQIACWNKGLLLRASLKRRLKKKIQNRSRNPKRPPKRKKKKGPRQRALGRPAPLFPTQHAEKKTTATHSIRNPRLSLPCFDFCA